MASSNTDDNGVVLTIRLPSFSLRNILLLAIAFLSALQCVVFLWHTIETHPISNDIVLDMRSRIASLGIVDIINHTAHDLVFSPELLYIGPHTTVHGNTHHQQLHQNAIMNSDRVETKVAIVTVILDATVPLWLDSFLLSAAVNIANPFQFFIIAPYLPAVATPRNVLWISMNDEELFGSVYNLLTLPAKTTAKSIDGNLPIPKKEKIAIMKKLFASHPNFFDEFKPCLGNILKKYLVGYSHWGYADGEQLFGDMHSLIPTLILNQYDAFTTSAGDGFRVFLRQQLSIFRNHEFLNSLWRSCSHYNQLATRLDRYQERNEDGWVPFSSEACFSKAFLEHKELKLFIASSQFNDNFVSSHGGHLVSEKNEIELNEREVLLIDGNIVKCFGKAMDYKDAFLFTASSASIDPEKKLSGSSLRGNPESSRNNLQSADARNNAVAMAIAKGTPLATRSYSCSRWMPKEYQTCLADVKPANDISFSNGIALEHLSMNVGHCHQAVNFEFHSMLQAYTSFTSRIHSTDSRVQVVSDFGIIPFRLQPTLFSGQSNAGDNVFDTKKMTPIDNEINRLLVTKYVTPAFIRGDVGTSATNSTESIRTATNPSDIMGYCAGFSDDIRSCNCPLRRADIVISHVANNYKKAESKVTFITSAWAEDFYTGKLDNTLDAAGNAQKIVVLARMEIDATLPQIHREDCTVIEVSFAACARHFHTDDSQLPSLPDNILYNIGLDAAATDLVCVCPADIVLDLPHHLIANEIWQDAVVIKSKSKGDSSKSTTHTDKDAFVVFPVYTPWNSLSDMEQLQQLKQATEKKMHVIEQSIEDKKDSTAQAKRDKSQQKKKQLHSKKNAKASIEADAEEDDGENESEGVVDTDTDADKGVDEVEEIGEESSEGERGGWMKPFRHFQDYQRRQRRLSTTSIGNAASVTPKVLPYPMNSEDVDYDQSVDLQPDFSQDYSPYSEKIASVLGTPKKTMAQSSFRMSQQEKIDIHTLTLLKQRTRMLPVLFNLSANRHGNRFVRFPEEMSGVGCFGTSIVRILTGAGYSPIWANVYGFAFHNNIRFTEDGGKSSYSLIANNKKTGPSEGGCLFGEDPNVLRQMAGRLNSYYLRAVELRKYGLAYSYTKEPFGFAFEKEQMAYRAMNSVRQP